MDGKFVQTKYLAKFDFCVWFSHLVYLSEFHRFVLIVSKVNWTVNSSKRVSLPLHNYNWATQERRENYVTRNFTRPKKELGSVSSLHRFQRKSIKLSHIV